MNDTTVSAATGHSIDLLRIRESDVRLDDVATSLERQLRFLGHSAIPITVAQHSVMVADRLPSDIRIHGLLHDAHEAYLGDIARPVAALLGIRRRLEREKERFDETIRRAFMVAWPDRSTRLAVKEADDTQLAWEFEHLWGCTGSVDLPGPHDWRVEVQSWLDTRE